MLRTEYEFTLPFGYLDDDGTLHREGVMRLATGADEITPLKDPRVQRNPAYLIVILLSRVITRLGAVEMITPNIIESIYASDLAYLQDLYNRINSNGTRSMQLSCPHCQKAFQLELDQPGEF
jgi:hypothetical protein